MNYDRVPGHLRGGLWRRLKARYGQDRATAIIEGRDPQANADLAAWRALGRPKQEGAA